MAGIMELIGKVFSTDPRSPQQAVQIAWLDYLKKDESTKLDNAQKLLDYYSRSKAAIREHLKTQAKITVTGEEVDNWQLPLINHVPRTIKRLSLAYKEAPTRTLVDAEGKAIKEGNPALDIYAKMFQNMDLDKKMKDVDRYSTLFNTLHLEVVSREGAIDWDIHLRPVSYVVPDPANFYQPYRFAYEWNPTNPDTMEPRKGWIVWEAKRHIFIDAAGNEYPIETPDGSNPYSEMPLVVVRKLEQNDYWGNLGSDLVDAIEAAMVQLGNIWETGLFQTHGQPFGRNLGLPPGSNLKTGIKNPILVDGVAKDKHEPKLEFVKPDTDLEKVVALVDWFLKSTGSAYGMPPSAFSLEETAISGFSKFMDNIELLENREEEVPMYERIEKELFRLSVMVWNRWAKENEEDPFPEDVGLEITFPQVSFPEEPAEEQARLALEIKNNVNSPVHYISKRDNITLDQALEKAKEYAKYNKEIRSAGQPEMALPPAVTSPAGTAEEGDSQPNEGGSENEGIDQEAE